MVTKKMMKTTWYPRPHDQEINFGFACESGAANQATIVPLVMYDEGLGVISDYESNPENANFVETDSPNVYPDSRINSVNSTVTLTLSKAAYETDKLIALQYAVMPIYLNFKEDQTPNDELSGLDIGEILEMQMESTDRQSYPLWNNVDMVTGITASTLLPASVPGLTTNQNLEAVAFSIDDYYDALHYYTNGNKLRSVVGGLRWGMLSRNRPVKRFTVRGNPAVKRANEYMFCGILIYVPESGNPRQSFGLGDTTNVTHMHAHIHTRYNEWNENFNHKKV